jgi:hypothetical protein
MSEPFPSTPIDRPPEPDRPYAGPGLGTEALFIAIPAAAVLGIAIRAGIDLSSPLEDLRAAGQTIVWIAVAVVVFLVLRWFFRSDGGAPATGNATINVSGHLHGPPVDGRLRRRQLLARHEGGHAAVVRDLGGKVIRGFITRNNDAGLVTAQFEHDDPIKIATFLYAGAAAAGTTEGAGFDYAKAEKEIKRLPRDERNAADRLARSEAVRLVRKNRPEVERIQGLLVVRGRI